MHSQRSTLWRLCGAFAAALAISACGGGNTGTTGDLQTDMGARSEGAEHFGHGSNSKFVIRTLGNRADLISDGDALVEVQVPHNVPLDEVKVTLNGNDITASFTADAAAAHAARRWSPGSRSARTSWSRSPSPARATITASATTTMTTPA